MIGENVAEDQANGFFMPIAKQLEMACDIISGDDKLQQGFHAVGFSQGGLFLRALAETCPSAKVSNLVSVGGPQQVRIDSALIFALPCPDQLSPIFFCPPPIHAQYLSTHLAPLIFRKILSAIPCGKNLKGKPCHAA
jgi:pimeloyl-ACP methyl ester carboxylesterase